MIKPPVRGHLDACQFMEVSGWAYAPDSPGTRLRVECLIDGAVALTARADRFREDLLMGGFGDGKHGYRFDLPPTLSDGRLHTVAVVAEHQAQRIDLPGSPITFCSSPAEAIRGAMHVLDDGLVSGWALNAADKSAILSVAIEVDGQRIAIVTADRYRVDLLALGYGDGCHGFELALAPSVLGARPVQELRARELTTNQTLPHGVIVSPDVSGTYWAKLIAFEHTAAREQAHLRDIVARATAKTQSTFSILMPVFDPDPRYLAAAIESVRAQSYTGWQLCIADDASSDHEVRSLLEHELARDERISVAFRASNGHISAASNSALALATGSHLVLLDHDDVLHPDALLNLAAALAERPDLGIMFSDEDKCDISGNRYGPYFKRGWNPDLMLGQNLVSHLGAYRTNLVREVGGFREGMEGSQDYDLALRVRRLLRDDQVQHIPKVLYHWRAVTGSTALANTEKSYASVAFRKALKDDLESRRERGSVTPLLHGTFARFRPSISRSKPKVTIVVSATQGRLTSTYECVEAAKACGWANTEVWLLARAEQAGPHLHRWTNDRGVRLRCDVPWGVLPFGQNWMHDADLADSVVYLGPGARPRKGRAGWLSEMVAQLQRPGVGMVGPKILDANAQVIAFGSDTGHETPESFMGLSADEPGPGGVGCLSRTVMLISGHAFAVRRVVLNAMSDAGAAAGSKSGWEQALATQTCALGLRCLVTPFAHVTVFEASVNA